MLRSTLRFPSACFALALLFSLPALADGPGELHLNDRNLRVSESSGLVTIVVERSSGEDGAVSVDYATSDGSAVAGADYVAASGTLSWADGDDADKSFTVEILDDEDDERLESFAVELTNPTGGATLRTNRTRTTVRIRDDDGGGQGLGNNDAGVFELDEKNVFAVEGGVAIVAVERSKGEEGEVSVVLSTDGGSAEAGVDYEPLTETLTWPDGDGTVQLVQVPITDDELAEGRETIGIFLSDPTGGADLLPGRSFGRIIILEDANDDVPGGQPDPGASSGVLELVSDSFEVVEGGEAVVRVERSRGRRGAVSVDFETTPGSATEGVDYEAVSGTLAWANGEGGVKSFVVPTFEDDEEEGNETVEVTLLDPLGGAPLDEEDSAATVVILDGDGSTEPCSDSDDTACLLADRFRVGVEWRTAESSGSGQVIPFSDNAVLVWFFDEDNPEMLVKLLDACVPPFENFWVFFAATTNVDFTVTVVDTETGLTKEYSNAFGMAADPVQDTLTFPCSE